MAKSNVFSISGRRALEVDAAELLQRWEKRQGCILNTGGRAPVLVAR